MGRPGPPFRHVPSSPAYRILTPYPAPLVLRVRWFLVIIALFGTVGFVLGWNAYELRQRQERERAEECRARGGELIRTLDGEHVCMGPVELRT